MYPCRFRKDTIPYEVPPSVEDTIYGHKGGKDEGRKGGKEREKGREGGGMEDVGGGKGEFPKNARASEALKKWGSQNWAWL